MDLQSLYSLPSAVPYRSTGYLQEERTYQPADTGCKISLA